MDARANQRPITIAEIGVKSSFQGCIIGLQEKSEKSVITGVEMFRKLLDRGEAGDNVGCLLRGVKKEDVQLQGRCVAARVLVVHTI